MIPGKSFFCDFYNFLCALAFMHWTLYSDGYYVYACATSSRPLFSMELCRRLVTSWTTQQRHIIMRAQNVEHYKLNFAELGYMNTYVDNCMVTHTLLTIEQNYVNKGVC